MPAVAILLLSLLAANASAQVAPTVDVAAEAASIELEPGQRTIIALTVDSTTPGNVLGGSVALAVAGAEGGWTATVEPATVPVGAGQAATLTLTAPADRDAAATLAAVRLAVTATLATPMGTATDAAELDAALTAAPPAPPAPGFPWATALGALGAAVLALGALVLGWRAWSRERGIELSVPAETDARAGYDNYVPIEVRNTSRRHRVAEIASADVPLGWAVGANRTQVDLPPGAKESLWLAVRPPIDAPPGAVRIGVSARPADARRPKAPLPLNVRIVTDMIPEQHGRSLSAQPYHAPGEPAPRA